MGAIKTLARLSGVDPIYGGLGEAGFCGSTLRMGEGVVEKSVEPAGEVTGSMFNTAWE